MLRGSRQLVRRKSGVSPACYDEVTRKLATFRPSRHVKMVWRRRQQVREEVTGKLVPVEIELSSTKTHSWTFLAVLILKAIYRHLRMQFWHLFDTWVIGMFHVCFCQPTCCLWGDQSWHRSHKRSRQHHREYRVAQGWNIQGTVYKLQCMLWLH